MYHSRHSRISCSLANIGSTWARATQWKARSHAAYHGYSHLSGIEMTSWLLRCRQPDVATVDRRPTGGRRLAGVAVEPARHVVVVELLRPQHAAERLAQHGGFVRRRRRRRQRGVELVGLVLAGREHFGCVGGLRAFVGVEAEPELVGRACGDLEPVPHRRLGADLCRVRRRCSGHDVVIDRILGKRRPVDVPQPAGVRLVVAEQRLPVLGSGQSHGRQRVVM